MAEKKTKKKREVKPAEKKLEGVLEGHPGVRNNARGYFRNENGKTIVQERVPRGDLPQDAVIMPRTEADLTDEDIRGIAKEAKGLIDPVIEKYDGDAAMQDALSKAIWTMGGGMYQNRVGANTQALILDVMKGDKGKSAKEASEEVEAANIDTLIESIPVTSGGAGGDQPKGKAPQEAAPPKEAMMDKETLRKEAANLSKKLDALKVLLDEDEGEDVEACERIAGSKKGPGKPDGTGPFGGTDECQMSKKDEGSEDSDESDEDNGAEKTAGSKKGPGIPDGTGPRGGTGACPMTKSEGDEGDEDEEKGEKEEPETAEASVVGAIDEIAEMVEKEARDKKDLDLFRIAFQLDCVSDYLSGEKDAAVLQSEPDEDFMRKAFHAGAPEKDADEPYMKEFDTDPTTEVAGVVGKTAASLPYPVKRD